MTASDFLTQIVDPGLGFLAYALGANDAPAKATPESRILLLAIAGQESGWQFRRQLGGPARSWWQMERGGGVRGLLAHPVAGLRLRTVCSLLHVPTDEATVFEAMAWNDHLAVAMARLLLWTDSHPLPAVGDHATAWDMYIRNWRPGRPRPETWLACYGNSCTACSVASGVPTVSVTMPTALKPDDDSAATEGLNQAELDRIKAAADDDG